MLPALAAVAALLAVTGAAGAGPANDNFASAQTITGWSGSITGSSVGATFEVGEPRHDYGAAEKTLWYAWTAPQSGSITFDTYGSDFKAFVSVYTGTRLDRLTLVARGLPTESGNRYTRLTFPAAQGTTYRIQIDGQIGSPAGNLTLAWNRPPPANDAFAAAQSLAGETGTITGTNWLATAEAGEPVHAEVGDGRSVWFRWTAPRTGRFQLDTEGRDYESVLAVYTGSDVAALSHVASNESKSGLYGDFSRVTFTAVGGTTYRIAVDGNGGGSLGTEGRVVLNWRYLPTPANDAFASGQALSGLSGSVDGTTVGATREAGEPDHHGFAAKSSVWYRYTPAYDGWVAFTTEHDWEERVEIYEGTSLATLTPADSPLVAGRTYQVAVDVANGREEGPFTLTWRTHPPENDDASFPYALWTSGTLTQPNVAATAGPIERHAGFAASHSLWYSWRFSVPGTLTVETTGSGFDTLLAVYRELAEVASDDDSGGGGTSRVTFRAAVDTEYHIAADGKAGAVGNLRLSWRFVPDRPANDDLASAQLVSLEKNWVHGRSHGATKEAGEPAHAGNTGGHSVWYRWIAPADGLAVFDTYDVEGDRWWDTDFDSTLAVYRGRTYTALEPVAANDDNSWASASRVSFPVRKGEEFVVAVDGHDGASGFFALNWNVGPPNDDFATAGLVSGSDGTITGTTWHATWQGGDGGEPHWRDDPPPNVWYTWRAPANGPARFEVRASSTYDPRVYVWKGASLPTLLGVEAVAFRTGNTTTLKFDARAGTVYHLEVISDPWGPFTLTWGPTEPPTTLPRPANDDFDDAQPLAGESGSVSGTNLYATNEDFEPEHHDYEGGDYSVWYRWTAPFTGTLELDPTTSDFSTVVAVYGGQYLDRLTKAAEGAYRVITRVGVTQGTEYRIALSGAWRGDPIGDFTLAWRRSASAPANDGFAARAALGGAIGTLDLTNAGASGELREPWHADERPTGSVWYSWTAPASGTVAFQTARGSVDSRLAAYRGSSLGTLSPIAQNEASSGGVADARVVFTAQAGETYQLAVDSLASAGPITLSWRLPPRPANDHFANAAPMPHSWYSVFRYLVPDGDNVGATREAGEPVHDATGDASVWYRFEWDEGYARTFVLTTSGGELDSALGVYTGSSLSTLTPVATGLGALTFQTAPKQDPYYGPPRTYWIAVDGRAGSTGRFSLSLSPVGEPANDHFQNAERLTGESGTVVGTVYGATIQHGEPVPGGFGSDASVWYRWTAPRTGTWRFDLEGTEFGAGFGVYSGDRVGSLVDHGSTDDEWRLFVPVTAGTTYSILVNADYRSTRDLVLNWRPAAVAANDNVAAAETLAANGGSLTVSTREASRELGEPRHAHSAGGASLWYRWTAPATGTVAFDTAGTAFDTVLAVYTGSSLPTLATVAENDDFAGELSSAVRFEAIGGTTYLLALDGRSWSPDLVPRGDARLRWSFAAPPVNDRFAAATPLSGESGSANGTTVGARREPGEPEHGERATGASVWYAWTAPADGNFRFDISASAFAAIVGVYRGTAVNALAVVRRSDDVGGRAPAVTFAATAGTTYRIAVDGHRLATGSAALAWSRVTPPNDAFAAAESIAGRRGTVVAATRGATREAGEPQHGTTPGGASVWYRWTAPASEVVTFDTYGSDFQTQLAVYTGSTLTTLARVGAGQRAARLEVVKGTEYRIAVDGAAAATGNLVLDWAPTPEPENDDFARPALIGGRHGFVHGTTFAGTREAGEADHAGAGGRHSLWYRFKAPATGTVTFETRDVYFDSVLAAYTGDAVGALALLAADNDSNGVANGYGASRMSFPVTAGAVYRVAVDGVGDAMGSFALFWTLSPANDDFAAAQTISGETGTVAGSLSGATPEAPSNFDEHVWYRWTAPATGTYVFEVVGDGAEPSVEISTGSSYESRVAGGTWREPERIGATAGTTYTIAVGQDWYGATERFVLRWRRDSSAPANDNVTAATAIAGTRARVSGVNVGSSREPGEPDPGGDGYSVWFAWTAPATGTLSVDTDGTTYDSYVGVYTGSTTSVLADAGGTGGTVGSSTRPTYSYKNVPVTAGTTYRIGVDGSSRGSYVLRYELNPVVPPSGSPYTRISSGPAGVVAARDASFAFATSEPSSFQCSLDGAAFAPCGSPASYTALAAGAHTFEVRGSNAVGTETLPARRTWLVAAGVANDAFASAEPIAGLAGDVLGTVTGASVEPGEPAHAGLASDRSAWYRWTAPRDGIATVRTAWYSLHEPRVGVYSGSAVDRLTPVQAIVPPDASRTPTWLRFRATAGTTYSIAVGETFYGDFRLAWRLAPANDDRRDAAVLTGASGTWRGDNRAARREDVEPRHAGDPGGASIWFRWVAPANGTLTLDTVGSAAGLDTLLGVYTESPYAEWWNSRLIPRASDDDSAAGAKSRATLEVFEGTAYEVAVDGFDGQTGDVVLNWRFSAAVDPTPPAVALTAPAEGARVRDWVALSAEAHDTDGVERVEFLVNGSVVAVDRTEPYSVEWNSKTLADGPATIAARAFDFSTASTTSAPRTVTVDNTPPQTTIEEGPSGTVSSTTATFRFRSSEPGSRFECSLDGGPYGACGSPVTYTGLAVGDHTFAVHAVDAAGNVDPSGDGRAWTVTVSPPPDTTPPETTITERPPALAAGGSATFGFSSDEAGAVFECALDAGEFVDCVSPASYDGLPDGGHRFRVRARDQAGNADPTPAEWAWTVDTVAPDTTIASGPPASTSNRNATFEFSAGERVTFECGLDGSGWAACSSPKHYSDVAEGKHTFRVRATDAAGNVDAIPATHTWTVTGPAPPPDTTPPETTITERPAALAAADGAMFRFSSDEVGAVFECALDDREFTDCVTPAAYDGLPDGGHRFRVRARDQAGNVDLTPAEWAWTIDTVAPETTVISGPPASTTSREATFEFAADEAGTSFECSLDGSAYAACSSPTRYGDLAVAEHTFRVLARDAAGNLDRTPATRTWTVEAPSSPPPSPPPPVPPPPSSPAPSPPPTPPASPPPPVPPPVSREPNTRVTPIAVVGQTVVVSSGGLARVRVACASWAEDGCRGRVALRRADVVLGSAGFSVAPDGTKAVAIRLSRPALTLLRRSRVLRVRAVVTLRARSGETRTTSRLVTLRFTG